MGRLTRSKKKVSAVISQLWEPFLLVNFFVKSENGWISRFKADQTVLEIIIPVVNFLTSVCPANIANLIWCWVNFDPIVGAGGKAQCHVNGHSSSNAVTHFANDCLICKRPGNHYMAIAGQLLHSYLGWFLQRFLFQVVVTGNDPGLSSSAEQDRRNKEGSNLVKNNYVD